MTNQNTQTPVERSMEEVYDRFDAAWASDVIPQLDDYVPVGLLPEVHRKVLLELVLIDLEKRWQRFHIRDEVTYVIALPCDAASHQQIPPRPLLEDYCLRYPVLGAAEHIAAEAIAHEFQVRSRLGSCPTIEEYTRRFPNRATELMTSLADSDSKLEKNVADTGSVSRPDETVIQPPLAVKEPSAAQSIEDSIEISSLRYPVPELAEGRAFGRYRIENVLGRGGMGAVYRAYDSHLQRTVALKVPFFKKGYSEEVVKRFLREARAVARLSHANLCRVFDVGVIDGTLFLTMEFVEGQSLEQLSKSGEPMPEADVVSVIRQVALALQEAHDCGIIHRDLKPANIMRHSKGQPVVMDFGLARQVDSEENDLTKDGAMLGTPAYMSPEQIRGKSREIGPATDIYSLGVVMYRLLTGRRPFEGTFTAILSAISTETPVSPRDLCGTVSPKIEAVCLKAMAKSASDRFASAAEMATALDEALQTSSGRGQAPPNSGLAEESVTLLEGAKPPILNSAVPDPSLKRNIRVIGGVASVALTFLIAALANRGGNPSSKTDQTTQPSVVVPSIATTDPAKNDDTKTGDVTSDSPKSLGTDNSSDATASVSPVIDSKVAIAKKPDVKPLNPNPILETHLQRAQQQVGFEVLSQKSLPLLARDKLQFHVRLNAPNFVYLYLIDTTGMPTRLWPETAADLEEQKPVAELWAPPLAGEGQKQKMYSLDDLHGQETVLVATSQRPLSQAELQAVETVRLNLTKAEGDKSKLISFRKEERERGIGGIVETDKALPVEIDKFTERLSKVFDGYTGIVFPHE